MKHTLLFLFCIFTVTAFSQELNSLDYDGIDDQVTVPGASALIAGTTTISITCWVYPTNPNPVFPDYDGFAGFRNESDCDFYVMQIPPANTIEARIRNSSGFYTIAYPGLTLNTWQHLAVTYDGAYMRLYVNGILYDSLAASGTITNTGEPFYIGNLPYFADNYLLTGKTDEVSLWSRTLSDAEINCIYHSSVNPLDPDVKLFYSFDQGTADGNNTSILTLTDASGHIDGVLNNFALNGTASNFTTGVQNATFVSNTICQGSTYIFGSQVLTAQGTYFQSFSLSSSCDSLVFLNLSVLTVDTSVTTSGFDLQANATGATFQWIDCNGNLPIPGATSGFFWPVDPGNYAVIVTQGNCTDTSTCYYVIPEMIGEAGSVHFILYPNPATQLLTLSGQGISGLEIYSAEGKKISLPSDPEYKTSDVKLDVSSLNQGIYYLTITTGELTGRLRFCIIR